MKFPVWKQLWALELRQKRLLLAEKKQSSLLCFCYLLMFHFSFNLQPRKFLPSSSQRSSISAFAAIHKQAAHQRGASKRHSRISAPFPVPIDSAYFCAYCSQSSWSFPAPRGQSWLWKWLFSGRQIPSAVGHCFQTKRALQDLPAGQGVTIQPQSGQWEKDSWVGNDVVSICIVGLDRAQG